MAHWRRAWWPGGTWFFTVNLLERRGNRLLVEQSNLLRDTVAKAQQVHPLTVHTWVVLPDHLHCILSLPEGDTDFPLRYLIWDEENYRRHMDCVHVHIRRLITQPTTILSLS